MNIFLKEQDLSREEKLTQVLQCRKVNNLVNKNVSVEKIKIFKSYGFPVNVTSSNLYITTFTYVSYGTVWNTSPVVNEGTRCTGVKTLFSLKQQTLTVSFYF